MDREEIIRMAREAGLLTEGEAWVSPYQEAMEHFAALVAAHEREACAKVCDVLAVHPEYASDITKVAAQAIRARSKK
jgi:hypothetical protein